MPSLAPISVYEAVALVFGAIGTGLGLFNSIRGWWGDRVRLRVRPTGIYPVGRTAPEYFGIVVTNLSRFDISVCSVGFGDRRKRRWAVLSAHPLDGGPGTVRLAARTSRPFAVESAAIKGLPLDKVHRIYAATECGTEATGRLTASTRKLLLKLAAGANQRN